jgi:hypothetical protein
MSLAGPGSHDPGQPFDGWAKPSLRELDSVRLRPHAVSQSRTFARQAHALGRAHCMAIPEFSPILPPVSWPKPRRRLGTVTDRPAVGEKLAPI